MILGDENRTRNKVLQLTIAHKESNLILYQDPRQLVLLKCKRDPSVLHLKKAAFVVSTRPLLITAFPRNQKPSEPTSRRNLLYFLIISFLEKIYKTQPSAFFELSQLSYAQDRHTLDLQ